MTEPHPDTTTPEVRYWTPAWHPAGAARPGTTPSGGRVLLLAAADGVERAVREALAERDPAATLVVARPGDRFTRLGDGEFALDPPEPSDIAALVTALHEGGLPERILLPRGAVAADPGEPDAAEREFFLLFHLTRELLHCKPEHPVRLLHAHAPAGGGVSPAHAAAGAFARVVRQEKPSFRYRA